MTQLKEQASIEQELHRVKIKQMQAQIKTMQSRINSHFLFNTLAVTEEMAWEEKAEKTSAIISRLSGYLRYSLDNMDKILPLQRELENVNDYFCLLRERFGDRILMRIDYNPECMDAAVPAMILQPLVENAYKHGVSAMKKGPEICLKVLRESSEINIQVIDNGSGMSADVIRELHNRLEQGEEYDDTQGIGIPNIVSRIKL